MALEKARRGVGGLVFVGTSNVASVRWCPLKAALTSVAQEPLFFAVWLHDRLRYPRLLGLIRELPNTDEGCSTPAPRSGWMVSSASCGVSRCGRPRRRGGTRR